MKLTDALQEDLGYTDVISHKTDTGDAPPIRQYPHRLRSPATDMLQKGVIQHSSSP